MDDLQNGAGLPSAQESSEMVDLTIVSNIEFNGRILTEDLEGNRFLTDIEKPNIGDDVSVVAEALLPFSGVDDWVFAAVGSDRAAEAKNYLDQYGYYTMRDLEEVFPQYSRVFSGVVTDIPSMIKKMIGTKE